jgi:type II secretory pathway pseudopilin PulG
MRNPNIPPCPKRAAGFTLPSILVVVSALLILAVGLLLVVSIERNTARSFVDRQRATLAARAGLEEVKGILERETSNDDFLVIQSKLPAPLATGYDPAPHLFIARGKAAASNPSYRYVPLFSRPTGAVAIAETNGLSAPDLVKNGVPDKISSATAGYAKFTTLPYQDDVQAAWVPVTDSQNRMIGRYAYWVEDLQSRVDARTAGNTKDGGNHKRYGWKAGAAAADVFPAPGLNAVVSKPGSDGRDAEPPLDQVALYALDPASTAKDASTLDNTIISGRNALVSPDSVLAVAGISPPLTRNMGHLVDPKARSVEEGLTAEVLPYDEQPLVPFANGIDAAVLGKPKLNLNSLLSKPQATAVDEMAAWIQKGLPKFDARKGGFPDNYLKTLAANAIDYADVDGDATTSGSITGASAYRGLDTYPLISEVILHIKYTGPPSVVKGRKILKWQMSVFVELWNPTNFNVTGPVRVSYENKFRLPAIGVGISGSTFDDPVLMGDPKQVQPLLEKIGDHYWSPEFTVNLASNQYKFYNPVTVNYTMDVGGASTTLQNVFDIWEDFGASGVSLMWKGKEVDRSDKLIRANNDPDDPKLEYITNFSKQTGIANIPGHSYGRYRKPFDFKTNMGDSRQSLYLRGEAYPLSDNHYPGNVSPNVRNIRNVTIYKNGSGQSLVYGRVLPSEWPDGGHDVAATGLALSDPSATDYNPADTSRYPDFKGAVEGDSPSFISNRGRFYSVTELGRAFDPIMYKPTYDNAGDTSKIIDGSMPGGRVSWPSVEVGSTSDIHYGGGNTLRIGRPEHPKFDQPSKHVPSDMPGMHAARLLDLFHTGKSRSANHDEREGQLVRIEGHVNLNTATEDALRATAAGMLLADPRLVKRTSDSHSSTTSAPPVSPLEVSAPTASREADILAQAIIRGRPYSSPSEIASALDTNGKLVFGNRDILPNGNKTQWSDAAAEESFARVYNSTTIRSRNFRVWVIGQAVAPTLVTNPSPEVLSETRRAFTIFADPGERNSDGSIISGNSHISTFHENDF